MSVRNLDKLFKPRSVALIGATPRPGSAGAVVARNLQRAGFKGELMLADPHRRENDGRSAYPEIASLPGVPDLAVIAAPPDTVPALIRALGERGTRAAVVISTGFAELGEHGRRLRQSMRDAAKPYLLRIVGPNCLGIMVPPLGLDASFAHLTPPPGRIAFLSRSAAIVTAMLDWALPRGISFSHVVSLGEMVDVDFGDALDYFALDPQTTAILLYIEQLSRGRKFISAARAAARNKPVLVLKAGRMRADLGAVSWQGAALGGDDAVHDAVFRRAGMLRVDTMAGLFAAAETLAATGEQSGERLAILTNGGDAGMLASDALVLAGLRPAQLSQATIAALDAVLPPGWSRGNPVDIGGDASGGRYAAALAALFGDPEIDAILVLNCPSALAEPEACARAVIDAFRAAPPRPGRNLYTAWLGEHSARPARRRFAAARIATYETPDEAVAGYVNRVRHRRHRELLMETPPLHADAFSPDEDAARTVIARALAAGATWLDPMAASAVLAAYGIPLVAHRLARDPAAAAAAAVEIGFPVALKLRSPDIRHKSEVGGVTLNLNAPMQVEREAAAMVERVAAVRPAAYLDGFLVQPMVSRAGSVELRAGLVEDPVFGPLVAFGRGGAGVEISGDRSLELPPLNRLLARRLMARTRVWQLLEGGRGRPPVDIEAVAGMLIRLGQLAADRAEIRELDLEPLVADADGAIALDVRIRVAAAPTGGAGRLAIAPYPRHLESDVRLPDGTMLALRPIRPEDEPRLIDLFAHMSAEDLRLRFFTPVRGPTHAIAARLSQLDYDRELALLAERGGLVLGAAHFFADPDNRRAEYAIAVRSDWHGRGVGYLLMTRLIEIAGERGIGELVGEVMRENAPMLQMCRELGFGIATDPQDPALMVVTKTLAGG